MHIYIEKSCDIIIGNQTIKGGLEMDTITRETAWGLLTWYNQEPFHQHHAVTVEGVMRYFARELGYED